MHPAYSVIFFTVTSGAGYGLLLLTGVLLTLDPGLLSRAGALTALTLAALFIVVGLISSSLHLGRKVRAWRAISQWKSSWLSREGVLALASLPILALFAYGLLRSEGGWWRIAAIASAAIAAATLVATAMIYASLKPIPQWRHRLVVPGYLLLGSGAGAMWLLPIVLFDGGEPALPATLAAGLSLASAVLKIFYWRGIDRGAPLATIETATGLGRFGAVRAFDPPHTSENYLLKEMGYRIARKHAANLRKVALILFAAVPLLALLLATLLSGRAGGAIGMLGAACAMVGLLVERWLFFAEARHTVQLYYGERMV